MYQIIIELVKYFTDLTSGKALRFLTAIVIVILLYLFFASREAERASNKTQQLENVTKIFDCQDENRKLIKERDSLLTCLYLVKLEQYQIQLKEAQKLMESSKKLVKQIKRK